MCAAKGLWASKSALLTSKFVNLQSISGIFAHLLLRVFQYVLL